MGVDQVELKALAKAKGQRPEAQKKEKRVGGVSARRIDPGRIKNLYSLVHETVRDVPTKAWPEASGKIELGNRSDDFHLRQRREMLQARFDEHSQAGIVWIGIYAAQAQNAQPGSFIRANSRPWG
jgi:hypothetical protein